MQYKIFKPRPELLLHPNIPKPLHEVNPRNIKGKEWWDTERKKVYASTNQHCAACGVSRHEAKLHKWLEAHEIYDIDYKHGRATLKEIVPLCHYCYSYINSGYLNVRYGEGKISREHYQAILVHGQTLTRDLKKPKSPSTFAPWRPWRLIFEDKEYEPKFESSLVISWVFFFTYSPPGPSIAIGQSPLLGLTQVYNKSALVVH